MEHYRSWSHSRYDIKYHFVWITKYRRKILVGGVSKRLRELIREVCQANDLSHWFSPKHSSPRL
ncbi:MAG: hypothetical protein GKR87_15645 [Kiritimatiellae bacterium]|nr:hypothetical protein [Kiritimatiellia bacterium]